MEAISMSEIEFKKLLIATVQADDYEKKQEILDLLKYISIRYEQTGEFTRNLWNHYKEYIQVCIVPEKLIQLKEHKKYIKKFVIKYIPK